MTKQIVFANEKGGVGKTTTTVMTAWALAKLGKRVLCVDLDIQGNLTSFLSRTYTYNHDGEMLEFNGTLMKGLLNDDIKSTIVNITENLDLLPSSRDFNRFGEYLEQRYRSNMTNYRHRRQHCISNHLQELKGYDYIFLDVPPTESIMLDNAVYDANIFIVCQTSLLSLEGAVNFYNYLSEFVDEHDDTTVALSGVIPVMLNPRSHNDQSILRDLSDTFDESLIITPPIKQMERLKRYSIKGITDIDAVKHHDRFDQDVLDCFTTLAKQVLIKLGDDQ